MRKAIAISLILLIAGFFIFFRAFKENPLSERVLVIVVANNYEIPPEIAGFYKKNEKTANLILSFIFNTSAKELEDLTPQEIAVYHGEEFLIDRYKRAASGYGKIVVLRHRDATYDNFKRTLINLDKEGGKIDILLNLHGNESMILFSSGLEDPVRAGELVWKNDIADDFEEPLNIGFVYQTLCYGGEDMDIWTNIGAEVVNGAVGVNDFVVFAPEVFLKSWAEGKSFKTAVQNGYDREHLLWKLASLFLEENYFDPHESRMVFLGDENYGIY